MMNRREKTNGLGHGSIMDRSCISNKFSLFKKVSVPVSLSYCEWERQDTENRAPDPSSFPLKHDSPSINPITPHLQRSHGQQRGPQEVVQRQQPPRQGDQGAARITSLVSLERRQRRLGDRSAWEHLLKDLLTRSQGRRHRHHRGSIHHQVLRSRSQGFEIDRPDILFEREQGQDLRAQGNNLRHVRAR